MKTTSYLINSKKLKSSPFYYWIRIIAIYSPFLFLVFFLKTKTGHWWDNYLFSQWADYNSSHGLKNAYGSGTDYLPLYQYVLYLFGKMQESPWLIWDKLYNLKNVTILFEFGTTLFLFKYLEGKWKDTDKAILYSLFYFLNIAVLYNSLVWGQVDGIMTFFIVGAVLFAWKRNLFLSLLFLLLAINFKLQAIIFLPLVGLLLLPLLKEKGIIKKILFSTVALSIILVLIYLPFILEGHFPHIWKNVIVGSVGRYSVVSMNANNLWYIFMKDDPMQVQNTVTFLGITYKNWGFFLFFLSAFFALFHFLKPVYQIFFKKIKANFSEKKVWISAALIPLIFFFFNVEMHERYSHPALIFLAFYAFLYKKPLPYIIISIAYLLNLETATKYFAFSFYSAIFFKAGFIATLYLIGIILLYLDLYDVKFKPLKRQTKSPPISPELKEISVE